MSTSKWAYDPKRCDGQPCPGDCDHCTRWQEGEEEARPKVYCRDCARRNKDCPLQVWCGPQDDDFCSRGVPKE